MATAYGTPIMLVPHSETTNSSAVTGWGNARAAKPKQNAAITCIGAAAHWITVADTASIGFSYVAVRGTVRAMSHPCLARTTSVVSAPVLLVIRPHDR